MFEYYLIRPDCIHALESPLVKKILSRYVKVVNNELPTRFQIAKRIVFDFDKSLNEEELWKEHRKLMNKFYEIKEVIDRRKLKIEDLEVPRFSLLDLKIILTKEILKSCELCERKCKVNRLEGKMGECKVGNCLISSEFIHLGEEAHISPSHTIFFMGCNFHCQYCFSPETFVIVNEDLKTIEEVFNLAEPYQKIGDCEVRKLEKYTTFTHKGKKEKILKVSRRKFSGNLITIKPYYLPSIRCTPEHRLFVFNKDSKKIEKIQAKNIKIGDYLLIPKLRTENLPNFIDVKKLFMLEYSPPSYKKSTSRITKRIIKEITSMKKNGLTSAEIGKRFNLHPSYVRAILSKVRKGGVSSLFSKIYEVKEKSGYVKFEKEKGRGIPRIIKITPKLVRLMGLYCAEGCVIKVKGKPNRYKLVFSYGKKEKKLIDETKNLLFQIFGVIPKILNQRTTTQLIVGKTSIALFFKILMGENSKNKKIPSIISGNSPIIIESFLNGYIDGDGWIGKDIVSMNTTSKQLAMSLAYLLLKLGKIPRFYVHRPSLTKKIEGRKVRQSPLYYVKFKEKNKKVIEKKNFWLIPVQKTWKEKYKGLVYNMEVKNDHSYLSNLISVANCQNWSISQWFEQGYLITPKELAKIVEKRREQGCRNVNFVGGEPTPNLLTILESLKYCNVNIPVVWNSNFYMSKKTMKILEGIVDLYLPDFKYGNDECALRLSKVKNYFEVVSRNHLIACKQAEVTVRHLILPNHVECCSKPVLEWIAKNIKDKCIVNIMDQYRPEFKASEQVDINRSITQEEFKEVVNYAKKLDLNYIT